MVIKNILISDKNYLKQNNEITHSDNQEDLEKHYLFRYIFMFKTLSNNLKKKREGWK